MFSQPVNHAMYKLRNGAEIDAPTCNATIIVLESMNPNTCIDLLKKCQDDAHQMSPENVTEAKEFSLLEDSGKVRENIKNIILAAAMSPLADKLFNIPAAAPASPGKR